MTLAYVPNVYAPRRRPTRVVRVGDVEIGGDNPIRVQSMTTTDTLDTLATADQTERLVDAGCEIVRITAPSLKEAENLAAIAAELRRRRIRVPLVADIHYTPKAALVSAEHVEKIRINPGNFADKKKFEVREYSDAQYAEEVERVAERFRPLVRRCAELGRALRIGTNHGSLADRIMNRYGDSPRGMVESALEFLDVCEDEGFHEIVFSMKSSNAQVAIQAYRLLAARLEERSPGAPSYPFHIGVTEAGDGVDGRIKSAIGIGTLLEDGLGDTVRVSLTEDPVKEVPVGERLARRAEAGLAGRRIRVPDPGAPFVDDPFSHRRRATRSLGSAELALGGTHPVRVELELGPLPIDPKPVAQELARQLGRIADVACEGLTVSIFEPRDAPRLAPLLDALSEAGLTVPIAVRAGARAVLPSKPELEPLAERITRLVVPLGSLVSDRDVRSIAESAVELGRPVEWALRGRLSELSNLVDRALETSTEAGLEDLLVSADAQKPVQAVRLVAARLRARGASDVPLVLHHRLERRADSEARLLAASIELGAPLCDGLGDAISIAGFEDAGQALELGYRILQGARQRTSWTEYISCPSCGRTLFDLEETTARVKARTGHLRGVKIAVMGCIVNGPGEMADADFGYVGSGPGTVNLFVGKDVVARHVPSADADDRLVELIRQQGRWTDPA